MKLNEWVVYAAVIIFSALFLFVGNRIAYTPLNRAEFMDMQQHYAAVVLSIESREVTQFEQPWGWSGDDDATSTRIIFTARITERGSRQGDVVTVEQYIADFFIVNEREISVSDRIMVTFDDWDGLYHFTGYIRINYVIILGVIFLALMIVFARKKGFNAIVALGFTCTAVFLVFIPAILSGKNIYLTTLIVCAYAIVSTLLIVIGANRKAFSAMLGCLGGVLTAGFLMFLMDRLMHLTGALDRETTSLLHLPIANPIDLRALVFAGVILGAVGAIMDVAMSISSSLWEVKEAGGTNDFRTLFASGVNIGKDILGTMLNTLILAYIGSSMTLILLIVVYTTSYTSLFNMEMITVEFLRALVGSFGMLLTVPLTAAICGWLYNREADTRRDEWDAYFGGGR
ncbi:MAG: YibE/F family protein [Defluviitaleaceae bacterium]|nr:YibE/F family protein [Defluviitaleaceae bacterium]MCL2274587.1 YibE/F family protein [Defluviitaleaceae bacterium]